MARKTVALSQSNLKDIPYPCRSCAYWLDHTDLTRADLEEVEKIQSERIASILSEWGTCGFLAYDGSQAVGYALYGPSEFFPKTVDYAAGPVSSDAIFLTCVYIVPEARGIGMGQYLLIAVERQMQKQKFKAIEIFASKQDGSIPANPVKFYLERGFYIKNDDSQYPLLRLDRRSLVAWRESVGAALENLSRPLSAQIPKKAPVTL